MVTINNKQEEYLRDLMCATYDDDEGMAKRIAFDVCAILDFIINTKEDNDEESS